MDIIDVMLARAMTPQGQTETYVSIANAAAAKAAKAEEDAAAAIAAVTNVAEDIADTKDAADALLATAQDALETAQQAQAPLKSADQKLGWRYNSILSSFLFSQSPVSIMRRGFYFG